MKKLQFIDCLRGFAVLAVLIVHSSQFVGLPAWFLAYAQEGDKGVQLFFVLSAFTLFYSMHNRKEEKNYILNFYIRRFFRIAPAFYLAMAFYLWYDGLGPRYWLFDLPSVSMTNVLYSVFFVNSFYPYYINSVVPGGWSVAIEMVFYLLVPIIFIFIKNSPKAIWLVLITIICSAEITGYFFSHPLTANKELWNAYMYLWFPAQLPIFCLGILTFYVYSNFKIEKNRALSLALLAASLLIMYSQTKGGQIAYFSKSVLFGIAFMLLTLSLGLYPLRILVNKWWAYIGKVSFSMYLVHFSLIKPVAGLMRHIKTYIALSPIMEFALYFLILLAGTIAISSLVYIFIEKNGVKLGNIVINKLQSITDKRKQSKATSEPANAVI